MTDTSLSAVMAVFTGVLLLPVVFVPYIAWTYRRRRMLGLGHAAISAAAVIYVMSLWTYTILPLPNPDTLTCQPGIQPQLIPFGSFADINLATHGWRDPALWQLLMNVVLFIPFGMLMRHLAKLAVPWVVLAGFGMSLLIELTQLTGVWSLYPCAYRIFDVDDLLTNTLGAGIGVALAPLLGKIPGQNILPMNEPRVVRPARRLLGMLVDLVTVQLIGFGLYIGLGVVGREAGWVGRDANFAAMLGWCVLVTAVALLLGVPWLARGATLGQLLVLIRPVDTYGQPPSSTAKLIRFATGSGGYFMVLALGSITDMTVFDVVALGWLVVSGFVALFRHPRGVSGYASGLTVADARDPIPGYSQAKEVDPRSLGVAAVALLTALYLGYLLLIAISTLSPQAGVWLGVIGTGVLLLASVGLVPALIANAVVMWRHEGRGVGSLLMLAASAAILVLFALLAVALSTGVVWLLVLALAALAVTGYLGFLFVAFLAYGHWYGRRRPTERVDAVVVLGSRVYGDRVPPLLAARINRGIEVFHDQQERYPDHDIVLICSGGQGVDEQTSEGEAMARYAVAHGVRPEWVLAETASRTTEENLKLSRQLLADRGQGTTMVVSTNNFHTLRAAIIARELGVDAQVVGADTARYFFPSAVMRDFVGVLARQPVLHAVTALGLAVLVGGLAALLIALA